MKPPNWTWLRNLGTGISCFSYYAGSHYFQDYCDLSQLGEIDWDAVDADQWRGCQDEKQAEFLVEQQFSWHLIEFCPGSDTNETLLVKKIG
ncbi:DarT ssDNA thymidine ADP-ribosyltransferase family protein [Candidatus Spongiihabitans sp.]|uniref:DarT ssDNA thymidine ADP-ribosyltransferase family protein n=1 Tax=Candidatus Spongiihabitans sp. TaxID=3101308 RepID=UPI003C7B7C6B